jgi:hypothetical protein
MKGGDMMNEFYKSLTGIGCGLMTVGLMIIFGCLLFVILA